MVGDNNDIQRTEDEKGLMAKRTLRKMLANYYSKSELLDVYRNYKVDDVEDESPVEGNDVIEEDDNQVNHKNQNDLQQSLLLNEVPRQEEGSFSVASINSPEISDKRGKEKLKAPHFKGKEKLFKRLKERDEKKMLDYQSRSLQGNRFYKKKTSSRQSNSDICSDQLNFKSNTNMLETTSISSETNILESSVYESKGDEEGGTPKSPNTILLEKFLAKNSHILERKPKSVSIEDVIKSRLDHIAPKRNLGWITDFKDKIQEEIQRPFFTKDQEDLSFLIEKENELEGLEGGDKVSLNTESNNEVNMPSFKVRKQDGLDYFDKGKGNFFDLCLYLTTYVGF